MPEPMFLLDGVRFGYEPGKTVLDGISLEIPRGMYAVLLGANGSGKSTLARHLNGLLLPGEGSVQSAGFDTRVPENILPIRSRVGMVFQHPDNQIVATTVEDDIAFGLENLGVDPREIEERVTWALSATGLTEMRQRPPHLLSGGQKQRLGIAGAIAMRQEALILDEATSSLDSQGRAEVLDLARRMHQDGATILAVTHRMDEVLDADFAFVLSAGRVVLSGTPREIFSQVNRLRGLNLAVPDVAAVAGRLHEVRPGISADCFTPGELLDEIRDERSSGGLIRADDAGQRADTGSAAGGAEDGIPHVVTVEGLSHTYLQGTPLEHRGLRHADLTVAPGEAVAIVGATGSGKSTVMQHLNGIMRPQSGRVVSAGIDLSDNRADVAAVRRVVGLLFQNPEDQLFEQLVGDDVAYGPFQAKRPLPEVRESVRWAMEQVGLDFDTFKDRPVFALSGGEKRKAALAGVLALRPKVLVLDEPTAGLDPRTAGELLERLGSLREEGVSLVFVTHNLDEVLALSDRIVIMADGETRGAFETLDVIQEPEILERHGFTIPPLLEVLRGVREMGLGTIVARRPDEAAQAIARALQGDTRGSGRAKGEVQG